MQARLADLAVLRFPARLPTSSSSSLTKLRNFDTIEHEGYLWLVPEWLDAPYQQMRKPARIIRLDKHKLQNLGVEPQTHQHLYRLADQLPKAVLDGGAVQQSKPDTPLIVVEAPELMIRRY
jgi:hypothetical protein